MTFIKQLNPTIGDVGGTDLLVPARLPNGRVAFAAGDTFGGGRAAGPPHPLPFWRSPVVLISDSHDPGAPIEFAEAVNGGDKIIPYVQGDQNPEFHTVLPCDMIAVGDRTYMWVMFTKALGDEKWCEILVGDRDGKNWRRGDRRWDVNAFDRMRVMITWEHGGDGWIYIYSTGGLARDKNVLQWRSRPDRLLDVDSWEPWSYDVRRNTWGWSTGYPTPVLPQGSMVGEMSVRRIQGHVLFAYFSDPRSRTTPYTITVKVGDSFVADWHRAPTYTPVTGNPVRNCDHLPQLYGGYIHPDSTLDRLTLIVSQWLTFNGGEPYRANQYLTRVEPIPGVGDNDGGNWETVLCELRP